jgi:hypothetical protein
MAASQIIMCVCFIILLSVNVLHLMGPHPLNTIVLVLLFEVVSPYCGIILSHLCIDFCNQVSDSAVIT